MLKTVKQLKFTFTSVSLVILLCISLILFLAQMALAQTNDSFEAVPLEVRTAQQADRQIPPNASSNTGVSLDVRLEQATAVRTEFIANHADRAADLATKRAEIQARRAANVAALHESSQSRIMLLAENATSHLAAAISRLENVSQALREHANAATGDTTTVIETLDSVDQLLRDASAALANINVEVEYVVTSDEPRTDWSAARTQFIAIRDILKEAHLLLRDAIVVLKTAAAEPIE